MPDRIFNISAKTGYEEASNWKSGQGCHRIAPDIMANLKQLEPDVCWNEVVGDIRISYGFGQVYTGEAALAKHLINNLGPLLKRTRWSMDTPQVVYSTSYATLRLLINRVREKDGDKAGLDQSVIALHSSLAEYARQTLPQKDQDYLHTLQLLLFTESIGGINRMRVNHRDEVYRQLLISDSGREAKDQLEQFDSVQKALAVLPYDLGF